MFIRAYLRASTDQQDANRAKNMLEEFVTEKNVRIAAYYIEHVSGTKLDRPELDRLIADSGKGDVLLIEKMDRLTRLPFEVWKSLKSRLHSKGLKIVVLDQPMTHESLNPSSVTNVIQQALTEFMLDLGAAMARDDYETRQRRQAQGIERARAEGRYRGKQINKSLHDSIASRLSVGLSYTKIQEELGCSRSTIAKVSKLIKG